MIAPLNRIIIFAGDVQKCAGFFRDAFGFTVVPSDDPPSEWLELETGGCRLAFHQAHGPKGRTMSPTGGP
jgi:glyoxalase/bleomycin resistance protein/dioxygenase superfamily protein